MNLILLKPSDFIDEHTAEFSDFRFEHIKKTLKSQNGDTIKIGLLEKKIGIGEIIEITEKSIKITVNLYKNPPKENPAILFCALPRPKVFRRILLDAVCFGVKEIHFFQSFKVEKSYWQSPFLSQNSIDKIIENALMQAADTILPNVYFHQSFKNFTEYIFTANVKNYPCFVFHPSKNPEEFKPEKNQRCGIVIGAEGGFTDEEIGFFIKNNAKIVGLGTRILKVEQAICAILGKL
ncbi:MAG: RNA methyltransferase [Chitinispirillales bacterium]|jgi:RsmE family RNA methyltransferase|nr:RNA methyltransferase [Chitinispirillales bacterium]